MIYRLENTSQSVIYFFFHIYAYDYSLATNHGVTPSSVVKRKTDGNEIKGTDIKRMLSNLQNLGNRCQTLHIQFFLYM